MEINDYQKQIRDYIDYPLTLGPFSVILDLQNNVGNLSAKLNDALIKDHGSFTKETKTKAAISIGDILFDLSNIAYDLGFSFNEIISLNLMKHRMNIEKQIKENETNKTVNNS
jgi:hypothetical protein